MYPTSSLASPIMNLNLPSIISLTGGTSTGSTAKSRPSGASILPFIISGYTSPGRVANETGPSLKIDTSERIFIQPVVPRLNRPSIVPSLNNLFSIGRGSVLTIRDMPAESIFSAGFTIELSASIATCLPCASALLKVGSLNSSPVNGSFTARLGCVVIKPPIAPLT